MSDSIYDRKKRHVEHYTRNGLGIVDTILSGDKVKIDKLIEDKITTPFSIQIIEFILKNNLPFESVSLQNKLAALEHYGNLGNQFTRSSSKLIESLPRRDVKDGKVTPISLRKYGFEFTDLEETFLDKINNEPSLQHLSFEERYHLVNSKIVEFIKNPEKLYPKLKVLLSSDIRNLNESCREGMLEGTRLYLFLYSQIFYPIIKEGENSKILSFEIPSQESEFYYCKDAESLFTLRFDSQRFPDSKSTVFHKDGKPILLQKTGKNTEYDITAEGVGTNATAINLEPIFVSGILYPPGTLFGVQKKRGNTYVKRSGNQIFETNQIEGLFPLRLTIFSISKNQSQRENAFGTHYEFYKLLFDNTNINEPGIEDFKALAHDILTSS